MNKRFELVILTRDAQDDAPMLRTLKGIAMAPGWTVTRGAVLETGFDEEHFKTAKELIIDSCIYDHKRNIGLKDLDKKIVKQLKKDGLKVRQPSQKKA